MAGDYLRAQVEAGAQALQVFDSWVGALDAADYREFVLPHVRALFARLAGTGVPVIHFGTGTFHLLEAQREAGGDVIGLDWRTPLDEGWAPPGPRRRRAGQPRSHAALRARASACSRAWTTCCGAPPAGRGHVFNLGHGILPGTPVENVKAVVDHVHASDGAPACAP